MKYAFTSFSLVEAGLDELFAAARLYGYDAVELRLDSDHRHGVELATNARDRVRLREQIENSDIEVVCLCSSVRLADPRTVDDSLTSGTASIELAGDLGVKLVRVFGGPVPDVISRKDAQSSVVAGLRSLGDHAARHDVTLCLETHDDWSAPQRLADVMTEVDHPHVGILWDVWHPARAAGTSPAESHDLLAPWIRHVHIHDGKLRLDRLEFSPIGQGDIDHLEILALLTAQGYSGTLSGEWLSWEPGSVHLPRERKQMARYEALLDAARSK